MIDKYQEYLNEMLHSRDVEIGDRVVYDNSNQPHLYGLEATLKHKTGSGHVVIEFDVNVGGLDDGKWGEDGHCIWTVPEHLRAVDGFVRKQKRKTNPNDPYNEENWEDQNEKLFKKIDRNIDVGDIVRITGKGLSFHDHIGKVDSIDGKWYNVMVGRWDRALLWYKSSEIELVKKLVRSTSDIDPYGEEDWEIYESKVKFNIGDRVVRITNQSHGEITYPLEVPKAAIWLSKNISKDVYVKFDNGEETWVSKKKLMHENPEDTEKYKKNKDDILSINFELDPYGEEDYDVKLEGFKDWFKVKRIPKKGDICIFQDKIDCGIGKSRIGKKCIVIGRSSSGNYIINFIDVPNFTLYCPVENLKIVDQKENEKMRKKMKDIDPYGEENWDVNERRIPYKKTLCSDLWEGNILNEKIKNKLVKIAKDFFNDVELETDIIDIHLTGSMVNYNYTEDSDIDVHIVIDFKDVNEDTDLVKKAVDGQRFIWNLRHNINIKGHDVELYIQDIKDEPPGSRAQSGLYSLLNDEWIKKPVYDPPNVDTEDVNVKYDARVYDILRFEKISKQDLSPMESEEYYNSAKELKAKIMKSRKAGLEEEGEFSIENLVFKKLRKENKIKKLIDTITRFYDKIYSQE
jgi:hypothetical protein